MSREQQPLLRHTLGKLPRGIVVQSTTIARITPELKQLVNEQVEAYLKSREFLEALRGMQAQLKRDEASLDDVKSAFLAVEQVNGIHVMSTEDGYDIVVTYPESMRLGEMLKILVPTEIELSRKYKNRINFEYVPASDFSDELKSSYRILAEHKE